MEVRIINIYVRAMSECQDSVQDQTYVIFMQVLYQAVQARQRCWCAVGYLGPKISINGEVMSSGISPLSPELAGRDRKQF